MNFGLNKYSDTISFEYINDVFRKINSSIITASDKNNVEAFNVLLDFIRFTLLTESFKKSINAYSKTTTNLIYIYPSLSPKFKEVFIDRLFESLTAKISICENYGKDENDIKYIETSYLPIINITKLILEEDNYQIFNATYKKIDGHLFKMNYIRDKSGFYFKFITTTLCWIYYLRFNDKIVYKEYDFKYFEENFEMVTIHSQDNFINVFFVLFDEIERNDLWAIKNWEVKKPPVNTVYFSLTPNSWLPFGLVMLLLKYNHLLNANDDLTKINLNYRFKYILEELKKILNEVTIKKEEYMYFIFNKTEGVDLEDQLNYRKAKILNVFSFLKKEIEIDEYKKIREVPLSVTKIEEFRNNIGRLWKENTIIYNILKHLKKVSYLPNDEKVDGYGFHQTLTKMRFAFIDGEHHQSIIGINDFGAKLARSMDNLFFDKLLDNKKRIVISEDISQTIDEFIDKTKNKENIVIFANWKIEQKLKNTKYQHEKTFPFAYRLYNNIPIIHSFNRFEDLIFIVDFSDVKINVFTNQKETWYENQLLVEVTEFQKEIITDDIVKKWKEKEGYEYNKEEVDVLESNNVNAKILFKYEYVISKNANYLIINGDNK